MFSYNDMLDKNLSVECKGVVLFLLILCLSELPKQYLPQMFRNFQIILGDFHQIVLCSDSLFWLKEKPRNMHSLNREHKNIIERQYIMYYPNIVGLKSTEFGLHLLVIKLQVACW